MRVKYISYYSKNTYFKPLLIIKLQYQVLTVIYVRYYLTKPHFGKRVFKLWMSMTMLYSPLF